jgi:hypothetical protein
MTMKKTILLLSSIATLVCSSFAAVKSGEKAPEFTGVNAHGAKVSLADLKGSYVVLEWLNHSCPFVKKFYDAGEMQRLQGKVTEAGGVWLTVASAAVGKQGYMDPAGTLKKAGEVGSKASHILLDTDGTIGKLYGARTTPQMALIAPDGTLIYQGAIDSISSVRIDDIKKAENYVMSAWKAHKEGKPVSPDTTSPYGCSVKY